MRQALSLTTLVVVLSIGFSGCLGRQRCHMWHCDHGAPVPASVERPTSVSGQDSRSLVGQPPAPIVSPSDLSERGNKLAVIIPTPTKAVESTRRKPKNDPRFGHADDYSWLIGHLQRVHVPGGEWKIRFMPIDKIDQWGGSMVLAPDIQLEDYEEDDVVYVEGEILSERPSLYVTGPLYRIQTIRTARRDPTSVSSLPR